MFLLRNNHIYAKPFSLDFKEQIYFADRLLIDTVGFLNSVQCGESDIMQRAFQTIQFGLEQMQGISWESI